MTFLVVSNIRLIGIGDTPQRAYDDYVRTCRINDRKPSDWNNVTFMKATQVPVEKKIIPLPTEQIIVKEDLR